MGVEPKTNGDTFRKPLFSLNACNEKKDKSVHVLELMSLVSYVEQN